MNRILRRDQERATERLSEVARFARSDSAASRRHDRRGARRAAQELLASAAGTKDTKGYKGHKGKTMSVPSFVSSVSFVLDRRRRSSDAGENCGITRPRMRRRRLPRVPARSVSSLAEEESPASSILTARARCRGAAAVCNAAACSSTSRCRTSTVWQGLWGLAPCNCTADETPELPPRCRGGDESRLRRGRSADVAVAGAAAGSTSTIRPAAAAPGERSDWTAAADLAARRECCWPAA